jgi:2,3-dihydroxybenzoate decarboxylase
VALSTGERLIALEEHYYDPEIAGTYGADRQPARIRERLDDHDALRLKEMDEAGIDVQVLSHGAPGLQGVNAETAVEMAVRANDRLRDIVGAQPDRFAAFAVLPVPDPVAAADELERAVTKLGFKGAMVHGLIEGQFLDGRRFWPIYERAAALDVPIYVHPATPHPAVIEAYYRDYLPDFPQLLSAGWGYTVETATQGIRLVLSGVFEAYPDLKIILGHMGESLPFSLWRINHAMSRPGNKPIAFRDVFCDHFYITTSGHFSTPALLCSMLEMGMDRILYSVDWPFVDAPPGTKWMETVPLSSEDKLKLASGNAERLLKL